MNFGRGSVLNEEYLLKSINKGSPKIAILDVTKIEPLPIKSELFDNPNIFLTPHISAFSPRWDRELKLFEYNLERFLNGDINQMRNIFTNN